MTKDLYFYGVISVSYIARKYRCTVESALEILCELATRDRLVRFDRTGRRVVFKKPYELRRELEKS